MPLPDKSELFLCSSSARQHAAILKVPRGATCRASDMECVVLFLLFFPAKLKMMYRLFQKSTLQDDPKVEECLGSGGFGTVYRGRFWDDIPCAIKVINVARMGQADRALLDNEISIWSALEHPHLLRMIGQRITSKELRIFSELMDESLHARHHRMMRLGAKPRFVTTMEGVRQICLGLLYLHDRNIMHRDLKSENVLVCEKDTEVVYKIGDFGLARVSSTQPMTAETGSYRWMAPEVIRHEQYDCSCDVYSLAMLMYEMLTLCVPFSKNLPLEAAFAVARDGARPPLPPLPDDVRFLVTDCWAQIRTARPTVADVMSRLAMIAAKKRSFGTLEMSANGLTVDNSDI